MGNALRTIAGKAALAAIALAAMAMTIAAGCSSTHEIHRQTRRPYPRIVLPEDIPVYADNAPDRGYQIIAYLDTDSVTTTTLEARESLMPQLRRMASAAGAEAVYAVQMLPRETFGMTRDPNAPRWVPAPAQDWTDRYFLRGVAVIADDHLPVDLPFYQERPLYPAPPDFPELDPERSHLTGPSPHAVPESQLRSPNWSGVISPGRRGVGRAGVTIRQESGRGW